MACRGVRASAMCGQSLQAKRVLTTCLRAVSTPALPANNPSNALNTSTNTTFKATLNATANAFNTPAVRHKSTSSMLRAAVPAVKPKLERPYEAEDESNSLKSILEADRHQKLTADEKARVLESFYEAEVPPFVAENPFNNDYLPKLDVAKFKDMDAKIFELYSFKRQVTKINISKSVILHSPVVENRSPDAKRPIVLLFPWLMAAPRAVGKYVGLHTDLGTDVLQVNIHPLDLLMPETRAQPTAYEVLDFLAERTEFDRILTHGMSVGGYGFQELLVQIKASGTRYLGVKARLVGQVYDSPCELPGLREGVARSLTDSRGGQERVMRFLDWMLSQRYESATRHYVACQRVCDTNYLQAPALFLYSRVDPIAEAKITSKTVYNWHCRGTQVHSHIFPDSPHVGHLSRYREDYTANLLAFMEKVGVVSIGE